MGDEPVQRPPLEAMAAADRLVAASRHSVVGTPAQGPVRPVGAEHADRPDW
ncbi:hypothetical protein [Streptomyces chrestomyceticus]|uniref:hypothetical protein n=1 Tax=Streptomyces chrestomyceticus TaxID=68185 RepID=UPI00142EF7E9